MESQRYLNFLLLSLMCFLCSSQAYNFYVGGKDGWVLNPTEKYTHWAGRNRFQVNDSLVFKYKQGSDSVLVVDKDDYNKCNKAKPIRSLEDGDSVFKFDNSGPFFFISGNGDNCEKGQKLIVVVLAIRNTTHKPSPSPSSSPSSAAKPSLSPSPTLNHPSHFYAPAPAPSVAPPAFGGGSIGLVMGLGVVLFLFVGLV
ncbi:Early nodulin-like protein 1 [Camellia lanceoleosa]|uniref:Early nodulin-like protein 1 n=1 Tax=Camellia lanceoleosa TaxID=1840588 RepID=A0ACC0H1R6_9ERIC|nr:Early nodulin-like protein 1 [Camellia lanceoleosa]